MSRRWLLYTGSTVFIIYMYCYQFPGYLHDLHLSVYKIIIIIFTHKFETNETYHTCLLIAKPMQIATIGYLNTKIKHSVIVSWWTNHNIINYNQCICTLILVLDNSNK